MTTILTKKKDTTGAPAPGDLTNAAGGAELAVNTADKRLYTKDSGGNVVEIGTNPTILNIDNIQIDGNTISSTNTNGNINLTPNGTGSVVVSKLQVTGTFQLDGNVTVGDSSADTLTINSTITSNLIFTDNTYDIGASGATRPRNLYLAGNATIAGNVGIGTTTLTEKVNVTGNIASTTAGTFFLDGTNAGAVANPTYSWTIDTDTGMYRPTADTLGLVSSGVERFRAGTAEAVFNDPGNDYDFRVESDGNTHMLFVDAGNNRVGVGTSNLTKVFQTASAPDTTNPTNGVQFNISSPGLTAVQANSITTGLGSNSFASNNAGDWHWRTFWGATIETGGGGITGGATNSVVAENAFSVRQYDTGTSAFNNNFVMYTSVAGAVFNEDGIDRDFRVESDTQSYMFWVDASTNGININGSDTIQGQLNVINNTGNSNASETSLYITTGNSYGVAGSEKWLNLYFQGYRDGAGTGGGNKARIRAREITGTGRSGLLQIDTLNDSGNLVQNLAMDYTTVILNEGGTDMDFRVESTANNYMFFVDAGNNTVNIGTSGAYNWYGSSTLQGNSWAINEVLGVDQTGWSTGCYQDAYGYTSNWKFKGSYDATLYIQDGDHAFYVDSGSPSAGGAITWVEGLRVADSTNGVIINEGGNDRDFRVESVANTHCLFVDASTSLVGINTSGPVSGRTLSVGGSGASIAVVDTNAGIYFGATATGFYVNPAIARASTAGFHIASSQVGDLCIGGENGVGIRFGTASGGGSLNSRMYIDSAGAVTIAGSLSKGSGSFRIDHPLPEKAETHQLVHSFIEGPQADLIYRGKVNLVAGRAEVNIDTAAGMTEGTFVALCRDVQCFTSNESDWDAVRGSVSGNILTIECQNQSSTASISWMVIGERQDKHMYDTDWTDENGKVIVEPLKPEPAAQ